MPVGLLDIAPRDERRETLKVGDQEIEIRGLTVPEMGRLCKRFPDLRISLFNDSAPEDVKAAGMLEAWPAIVALGVVKQPGETATDAEREAAINRMPQEMMLAIGTAIMRVTNPEKPKDGERPLAPAAEAALAAALEEARAAGAASTSSAPPSNS
jgi:hypothetical protein